MTLHTLHKPLRLAMPRVAKFIDVCREVFGARSVDQAIRNAMVGGTDFWARENGHTVGHLPRPPGACFAGDQLYINPKPETTRS